MNLLQRRKMDALKSAKHVASFYFFAVLWEGRHVCGKYRSLRRAQNKTV